VRPQPTHDATHFEVRCPRCGVSFPPETRRCLHCGGPTTRPGSDPGRDWVWKETETPTSGASEADRSARETGEEPYLPPFVRGEPQGAEEMGEETPSMGRTLLRTFGSLIWIVVLIAFTLARDCGGE